MTAAAMGVALAACGSSAPTSTPTGSATTAATTNATTATTTVETTVAPATTLPATTGDLATTVVADCGAGAYEPARIVVTCGDGTVVATGIRWSAWTTTAASGTSVVQVNRCVPTCASASARPFGATLRLSGTVSTAQGPRFAHLVITWTGTPPFGQATNSYSLVTST